ncbi:MAG: helix-turn-helix transcriptional regulator [Thermodesulfobacteriota bacterium]
MKKWNDLKYQSITDAKIEGNTLTVNFEDGNISRIPVQHIIPLNVKSANLQDLSYNSYEIIIPTDKGDIEIPWSKIRLLSDDEFGAYMAKSAEQEAKKIGNRIRFLRESRNLKSKDVAFRAGITPQSLSRIEGGRHDIGFATLQKILTVMGYELSDLVIDEPQEEEKTFSALLRKLSKSGIDKNLVLEKIIPRWIQEALQESREESPEILVNEAAKSVSDVFGWPVSEIWSKETLTIDRSPALNAFFKSRSRVDEKRAFTYSVYVYKLCQIILLATSDLPRKKYPETIQDIKSQLFTKDKFPSFEDLITYIWDLGICVIPLSDSGLFYGASWNIKGRHCIILKQKTRFHARWYYDLLHEFYHVLDHLSEEDTGILENEEISPFTVVDSKEEKEANSFANHLIFDGRAEDLAQQCVKVAEGKLEKLKWAVIRVAKQENILADFLANYLAFRLNQQGENWWGTANNLQLDQPLPITIARDVLINHLDFRKISDNERILVEMALEN